MKEWQEYHGITNRRKVQVNALGVLSSECGGEGGREEMDLLMPIMCSLCKNISKTTREERSTIMEYSAEFLGVQLQEMHGWDNIFKVFGNGESRDGGSIQEGSVALRHGGKGAQLRSTYKDRWNLYDALIIIPNKTDLGWHSGRRLVRVHCCLILPKGA